MSEVRGNCRFCADFNHSRVHPPCDVCTLSADRPHWSPSATGRVALRLEADNAALRAQVQRVREALDELECCKRFERAFSNYTASERTKCLRICAAIRAALDPPQAALSNIQVAAEQAAAEASDMQRRLRMKPEDMTRRVTPLDPPTLGSLRGIAPGMTGEADSVEFVRRQRDGEPEVPTDYQADCRGCHVGVGHRERLARRAGGVV